MDSSLDSHNAVATYELKAPENDDDKGKLFGGKIYAFFLQKDPEILTGFQFAEKEYWLSETARIVAKKENIQTWIPNSQYLSVTVPDKMPEIKKSLLEHLFEEPELIENKKLRKKVREYLSH